MLKFRPAPMAILPLLVASSLAMSACSQPTPVTKADEATDTSVTGHTAQADWNKLQSLAGQLPSESGLFETSVIAAPLQTLLGNRFETFKTNFQVESPLQAENGILFTSGNKASAGGSDVAYLLINPADHGLEVGLWENSKLTTFKTQGNAIPKPKDIQTLISNAEG